jgi:hypothetical protein
MRAEWAWSSHNVMSQCRTRKYSVVCSQQVSHTGRKASTGPATVLRVLSR